MLPTELLAVAAGLASAASYGAGDFTGGFASRRYEPILVVLASQFAGLAILLAVSVVLRLPLPPGSDLGAAGVAGALGTIGLVRFYRELSAGRMGVIAPLTAVVTVTIPVLFGTLTAGLPTPNQFAGILLALAAIWFITRAGRHTRATWRDLGVVFFMGALFSVFLVTIGTVSERSITWPLVASRAASVLLLLIVIAARRGPPVAAVRDRLPLMAFIGLLDIGGSSLFALSSALGRLDVAAVLASLYPAVTVLLARSILAEEINGRQWFGLAAAVASIVLITV